jgi:hypothetical protein
MHRTIANFVRETFLALSVLVALACAICLPAMAQSTPWTQQADLTASDGASGDAFGVSVAVDANAGTAVVGSPGHTVGSNQGQGAAYVFMQNGATWSQQAELTASDGASDDSFGSVALSGSMIVVGAPYHAVGSNSDQGAAYVFVQNADGTWAQQAELIASDGAAGDNFGFSVTLSGSTVVVGAPDHTVGSNQEQGAAYVFVQNGATWSQQAELTASDGAGGDSFGAAVAANGGMALVGAFCHPVSAGHCGSGAAYVFAQSGTTWGQQAELTASNGVAGDEFGISVALSGSAAVVGAAFHPAHTFSHGPGAAYVFGLSGGSWGQQAELTESDAKGGDDFGWSVALNGSTALVGAWNHAVGANFGQGAAFVFAQNGEAWRREAELTSSDGEGGNTFGWSVAVSGGTALAGAIRAGSNLQGEAYVFVAPPTSVTLSPGSLNFGDQAVNASSAAKTATLKNTGPYTLDIGNIALNVGTNFTISSNTCGATLAAAETCKVGVTFTPTQLGALSDTLTFNDNGTGSPQSVSLSGTGEAQTTLTPATYTFSKTKVGDTSAAHKFTLKNNLPTTLTGISYLTAAPFAVSTSTSTCGTTLDSKKSCTISVTFSPTSEETFTGALTVNSSANNSPLTSTLTGTGD